MQPRDVTSSRMREIAVSETEPTAPADAGERRLRGESNGPPWLTTWAPLLVSFASLLVSLVVSAYTIYEAKQEPDIWLSAPDVVRIAAGDNTGWFYVQPRLVNTARNDRGAVITKFQLEVAAGGNQQPDIFICDEFGIWQYDVDNGWLSWMYLQDATPLVVNPGSPLLPTCNFVGPDGWNWQPGSYQVTILAWLDQKSDPLRTSFAMTLPDESFEFITTHPTRLWELPTQVESAPLSQSAAHR